MTAAHDFEDLRYALEHFSPQQARRLRLIISQDEELAEALPDREAVTRDEEGDLLPDSFLALSGSIEAPAEYAERHDDYIRERTEQRAECQRVITTVLDTGPLVASSTPRTNTTRAVPPSSPSSEGASCSPPRFWPR